MAKQENNKVQTQANEDLDRVLDAALAKYFSIEPRAGLEGRVLANLRAGSGSAVDHRLWRWGIAAAAVAALMIAFALGYSKHSEREIAIRPPDKNEDAQQETKVGSGGVVPAIKSQRHVRIHAKGKNSPEPAVAVEARPKLAQFPSPQPLSEQEQILANYVAQFPKQAILIARLRTEELQQDQLGRMREVKSGDSEANSNELKNDTTER